MSTVQQATTVAVGNKDMPSLEALMMKTGGNLPLYTPSLKTELNNAVDSRDGDSSKPSSGASSGNDSNNKIDGNGNNLAEEFSNLEDYRNARSKLAFFKQQKSARLDNGAKKSPGTPSRRRRRRQSDTELVRKQLEEMLGTDSNTDGEGGGSSHRRMIKRKSKTIADSRIESPTMQINESNSLSTFISHQPKESRQDHRSSKSTNKTITSSSTDTTKKQSNQSGSHRYSVNDLVQNSSWAGRSNESAVRRPARLSRARTEGALPKQNSNSSLGNGLHQQHSNYHWIKSTNGPEIPHNDTDNHRSSTPNSDRPTKSLLARRRSSGDVSTATPSGSGGSGSRRPRRKLRLPSNGSTTPSSRASRSPHSSRSRSRKAVATAAAQTPRKETAESTSDSDPVLMTPYNVLQDPRYKRSARSYSDLVMIAADSNKSPIASLKKILRDEKEVSASGKGRNNEGTDDRVRERSRSAGRQRRKSSRSTPHPLLKIPFSDGEPSTETNEKQPKDEYDNSKAGLLGVQGFGKSVAKSMKKQAQNTKRRISRQISNAKAATTSRSTSKSHVLLDSTDESNILDYESDESDSAFSSKKDKDGGKNSSPLPLKAPSGHRGLGGESYQEPSSRFPKRIPNTTMDMIRQNNRRVPLKNENEENSNSPLPLRPPSGHVKQTSRSSLTQRAPSGNAKTASPLPLKAPSGHMKDFSPLPLKPPSGQVQQHNSPTDRRPGSPEDPNPNATEYSGRYHHRHEQPPLGPPPLSEAASDGEKIRKKRGSKINRMIMRAAKKNETKSTKNSYEQLNSSIETSSFFKPVYRDNDNEQDSATEFTVNNDHKGIQFVFYGDSTSKGDNSSSFHKPTNGGFGHDDSSVTQKTEPTSSSSSRAITCKQIYTPSDRDTSISTFVSSVATLDSRPRSRNTSEKSSSSQIQNTSILMVPNLMNDERQKQSPGNVNAPDEMDFPIQKAIEDKEGVNVTNKSLEPVHNEITAEVDPKAQNIESELGFNKKGSKEKGGDDALSQTRRTTGTDITGSESSKKKRVSKHKKYAGESITEKEIFDLLKKESRKARKEAKDRKDSSRERAGRHKKESRKLRQKKLIVDMDITVNSDPLEISEISNPYMHTTTERKKPAKTLRSSMSKSDSRGKMKTGDVRKDRKSSSRKRASKEGSMSASIKDAVDLAIYE